MSKNFYKFSATWCGSCKIIQSKWKEIKNEYKNVFNFIDVDVDNDPDLVEKFGISQLPTFVITDADNNLLDKFITVEDGDLIDHLRNAL